MTDVQPLSPAFLTALATQIGSLSAFLGGFAATFLATLIVFAERSRAVSTAIACACVSAVAFVVAVVASTMLVALLHPDAPGGPAGDTLLPRAALTLAFAVGAYALLAAVGVSGFIRSRATGRLTGTVAALGALLVTLLIVQIK